MRKGKGITFIYFAHNLPNRVYGIIPLRRTCERNNVEYLLVGDADNVWYFPEVEPEDGENEKQAAFRAVDERTYSTWR